jgi:hypothetical protein
MTKFKAKQAAEIIAENLGWDIADVRDCAYQPTIYRTVKLYSIDNQYFCCPRMSQQPPKIEGLVWSVWKDFAYSGRTIYVGTAAQEV